MTAVQRASRVAARKVAAMLRVTEDQSLADLLLVSEEELMRAAGRWLASLETYERRRGPVEKAAHMDCIDELRGAVVHWQRDRDALVRRTTR